MEMRKRIMLCGGAVLIVGLVILAVMIWRVNQQDKKKQAYLQEYTEKLYPWESERDKIEQEITLLDKGYKNSAEKSSTLSLLFTELDERVYTEIYPQMKNYGFAGTLAFSPEDLPGMEGKITIQQFQALQNEGWTSCVSWDGETSWDTWMEPVQDWYNANDMNIPDVIYLTLEQNSDRLNDMLMEQGFQTVICNDRNDVLIDATNTSQDFWKVWSCGWLRTDAGSYAKALAGTNNSLVVRAGFTLDEEVYEINAFERMMKKLQGWQLEEKFVIRDLTQARQGRQEAEVKQGTYFEEYTARKQELETQLDNVKKEIEKIEATYDWNY